MPNTHRRHRRDTTVELSCVGGMYAPVGCRDPVYNSATYMWLKQKIGWVTSHDWRLHVAFTPPTLTQLNSTVELRRRRRCVLGLSAIVQSTRAKSRLQEIRLCIVIDGPNSKSKAQERSFRGTNYNYTNKIVTLEVGLVLYTRHLQTYSRIFHMADDSISPKCRLLQNCYHHF